VSLAAVGSVLRRMRGQSVVATISSRARSDTSTGDDALVDPRALRFNQAITASCLLIGIALQVPASVFATGVMLNTAVWSRWRLHPYSIVW